jgi:hypothetical protein
VLDELMARHKGGYAAWLPTGAVLFCALIPGQIRAQPVWNATEEWRLGSIDGPAAFETIADAAFVTDRRILISQPGSGALLLADATGTVTRIGRRGSGPGEFQRPTSVGVIAGSLWVWDGALGRISFFDETGAFVRSSPASPGMAAPLETGAIIVTRQLPGRPPLSAQQLVLRFEPDVLSPDTIDRSESRFGPLEIRARSGLTRTGSPPFPTDPLVAFAKDGRGFAIVSHRAEQRQTAEIEVRHFDARGSERQRSTLPHAAVPLSIAEQQARAGEISRSLRDFVESRGLPAAASDFSPAHVLEAMQRGGMPATLPSVSAAFIDRDGTLWLAREDRPTAASREWWRLSPGGEILARLSFPRHLTLLDAWNDRVLGSVVDELGVTRIIVYRIAPG